MSNLGAATAAVAEIEEVNGKAKMESTAASVSASEGMANCKKTKKKKKKKKRKQEEENASDSVTLEHGATSVVAAGLEGTPKLKKEEEKAKDGEMAEQEAATKVVSALDETPKCKKKKEEEEEAKERVIVEEGATTSSFSGTSKLKKKKKAKAKEGEMVEQDVTTKVVSASEGTPKVKKEAKAKEGEMAEHETTTNVVSAFDETPKRQKKEEEVKERRMVEEGASTSAVSVLEGTSKCNKKEKEKGRGTAEHEATATTVSGILKCKKNKEKAKEAIMDEPEPSVAVSASEGTSKHKRLKKKKKKKKMQEQQESPQALSGVVAVAKVVDSKPGNTCENGEGASRDTDVSMDPINGEDPNCSEAKDAYDKVNCKAGEGIKNCSENFNSLQESSEDRMRRRKRPKRKRKWDASSRGPDMSQDGGRVSKRCLDSSMGHDHSCMCASCLAQAHKEKFKSIYSPRGSLIRFQRKKLLILDLNGLLADINMDYQNAHMAHGKVRDKLVFRRPYCHDFLRFCFQNFELGIWSSRKKDNVNSVVNTLMRDLKQYLLFCWDTSKCTTTGCKTVDNKNKPLVLKELKKLWNKEDPNLPWEQGEFSPSNTLLVDDSPYKALCNPPHTAIFPQPYSYLNQRDDYSLGPGGDLRVYLERLAAADDVQVFVRDNPFGQPSITESDPNWDFYAKIVDKVELGFGLKCKSA